jgi:hypothetical protein
MSNTMIVRSLDGSHDWNFGKGKQSYLTEANAIAQCIQTRLLSFVNNCWFDVDAGIDWLRLLGSRGVKDEIMYNCKKAILGTFGVTKITSFDITLNGRNAIINFSVETIYTQNANGTVEV